MTRQRIALQCGLLGLWLALLSTLAGCGLTPDRGPPVIVSGGGCQYDYDSFGARTSVGGCSR